MKRGNKRVERYRKNSVHPEKDTKHKKEEKKYEKVNAKFMDKFVREAMSCGCCKQIFNLDSNELKVHCNICNKFFHCGIAGECIGNDCKVIDSLGNIHRARYCVDCVSKIYSNRTCLCKDCSKEYN
tara:strand:+ start:645 stop:1022 length:378 start_codon:yes stop_codon:yes gene_type:complete